PMRLEQRPRVASLKSVLLRRLTGKWIEDHGTASASGLFNVRKGLWDSELLDLVGLNIDNLPAIADRTERVGLVRNDAAVEFGLPAGTPLVVGSGDGFLANLGSGCESSSKISITLGTSAAARQTLSTPALDPKFGTFCYRADANSYLLGCAGSNGGN